MKKYLYYVTVIIFFSTGLYAKFSPHERYMDFSNEKINVEFELTEYINFFNAEAFSWENEDAYLSYILPEGVIQYNTYECSLSISNFGPLTIFGKYLIDKINEDNYKSKKIQARSYDFSILYDFYQKNRSNKISFWGMSWETSFISLKNPEAVYYMATFNNEDFYYTKFIMQGYSHNLMLYYGTKNFAEGSLYSFRAGLHIYDGEIAHPSVIYTDSDTIDIYYLKSDINNYGFAAGFTVVTNEPGKAGTWLVDLSGAFGHGKAKNSKYSTKSSNNQLKGEIGGGFLFSRIRFLLTFFFNGYSVSYTPSNISSDNDLDTEIYNIGFSINMTAKF